LLMLATSSKASKQCMFYGGREGGRVRAVFDFGFRAHQKANPPQLHLKSSLSTCLTIKGGCAGAHDVAKAKGKTKERKSLLDNDARATNHKSHPPPRRQPQTSGQFEKEGEVTNLYGRVGIESDIVCGTAHKTWARESSNNGGVHTRVYKVAAAWPSLTLSRAIFCTYHACFSAFSVFYCITSWRNKK